MDGIAGLDHSLIAAFKSGLQFVLRLSRRKQFVDDLKPEHESLKRLQKCVVQIAGNASALFDALLQAYVEFMRQTVQPVLVKGCEYEKYKAG